MESGDGARDKQTPGVAGHGKGDMGPDRVLGTPPGDHGTREGTYMPLSGRHLSRTDIETLLRGHTQHEVDLRGVDLRQSDLTNLDLAGVHLEHARLDGARLERCSLCDAHLTGAQLAGAHLGHADLSRARLEDANLEEADLRGATLIDAWLTHAQLSRAQLDGAALQGAHLTGAQLAHSSLVGTRLRGAHLNEATLWGVRLDAAELDGAHFGGADLDEADLDGAFLAGSALADADLAQIHWERLCAGEERTAQCAPLRERPDAYRAAADAYRRLRQACTTQGLYDHAGEMYRREMRMRQHAHGYDALATIARVPALLTLLRGLQALARLVTAPARGLWHGVARGLKPLATLWHQVWKPVVRWVWYVTLELLCGYGERVGRVVIAAACVMLGMALIYLRLGQLTEPAGGTVTSFWHALYFSACSFSSIGYAAFSPNAVGLTKWLGVAESFTGNFLLALFLVTFTRKLTR